MNPQNNHGTSTMKKTLKKVRKPFLNNKQQDENDHYLFDPPPQLSDSDLVYSSDFTLISQQDDPKKSCHLPEFGLSFDLNVSQAQDLLLPTTTRIISQIEKELWIPENPVTKQCKDLGDAQDSVWAERVKNHYISFPKNMPKYLQLLHSDDAKVSAAVRKLKNKAVLACREIEGKHAFQKVVAFARHNSFEILSISYGKNFLEEIGHTPESFVSCTENNDGRTIFDSNCAVSLDISKSFFDCLLRQISPVHEGTEYTTCLFDKNGTKLEKLVQDVHVLEPVSDGIFIYAYFLIKEKSESNKRESLLALNEEEEPSSYKVRKIVKARGWFGEELKWEAQAL